MKNSVRFPQLKTCFLFEDLEEHIMGDHYGETDSRVLQRDCAAVSVPWGKPETLDLFRVARSSEACVLRTLRFWFAMARRRRPFVVNWLREAYAASTFRTRTRFSPLRKLMTCCRGSRPAPSRMSNVP